MNFDATAITIRERSFAEVLDLALRVVASRPLGLLAALVAGAAPWALLNGLLLHELADDTIWGDPSLYVFWMTILMTLEAPIATAPITLYLGQVMFSGEVETGRITRDYFRCLPQMLLLQGVARAVTVLPMVSVVMPYCLWPYLSELILLERNPLFVGKKGKAAGRLSTTKRSKNLHRGSGGDLFGRWMASLLAGSVLMLAAIGGMHELMNHVVGYAMSNRALLLFVGPAGGWLVVGFFAVVRFLAYLDLRIRREGWEVELKMRAEAAKIVRPLV